MSMEMVRKSFGNQKQILAMPNGVHSIAIKLAYQDSLADSTSGRYIVKAGTIYPANDETAEGVILNDYDVTDGDAAAALVVEGFVQLNKLPEPPEEEAIAAMPKIKFVGDDADNYLANLKAYTDTLYTAKS